jgi:ACS family allantoate permease-like MFS transporter
MSLESSGVFKDQKHHAGISLSTKDVDTGAQLVAGLTSTLHPDEALRIRCVVKLHAYQHRSISFQEEDR